MRNWADVSPTEASALSALKSPKRGMGGAHTAREYSKHYACPHCDARAYVEQGHVRVRHRESCPRKAWNPH